MSVQTVNASITNQTTALLDALSLHVLVELTSDCTASNSMLGECPPKITVRRCDDVDKLYEVQVDAFAVPVIFVNRVGAHDLIRRSLETVYVGTLVDTLERKYAARLDDAAQGIDALDNALYALHVTVDAENSFRIWKEGSSYVVRPQGVYHLGVYTGDMSRAELVAFIAAQTRFGGSSVLVTGRDTAV